MSRRMNKTIDSDGAQSSSSSSSSPDLESSLEESISLVRRPAPCVDENDPAIRITAITSYIEQVM